MIFIILKIEYIERKLYNNSVNFIIHQRRNGTMYFNKENGVAFEFGGFFNFTGTLKIINETGSDILNPGLKAFDEAGNEIDILTPVEPLPEVLENNGELTVTVTGKADVDLPYEVVLTTQGENKATLLIEM